MNPRPSRPARRLLGLVAWPVLLACLWLAAGSTTALGSAQPVEPNGVAQVAVATPDVWFTVTPTSEYGKVSSYCTTPCLTVTYTTQYHYGPTCGFPVNFYWDKTNPAGGGQVTGPSCTTPKMKQLQIDGVTYGTHQICAIPYPTSPSDPVVVKCVTFHVLKPAPKPTPSPKPTPKPTEAPTPTPSPSPSPAPTEVTTPTATAVALVTATPSPATAPPTNPDATPVADITQTGGAAIMDFTPILIGGAIFLILLVVVVIAMVRRARVLPPPR